MLGDEELAEVYGGHLVNEPSIYRHFEKGLHANPHGAAVISMHQEPNHLSALVGSGAPNGESTNECLIWTHAQLHEAATKLALGLHALGVQSDSTLVTLIPSSVEWALLWMTSSILRLTLASLDYGALTSTRGAELGMSMKTLKPSVVVVSNGEDTKAVDDALESAAEKTPVKIILNISEVASTGWKHLLQVVESNNPKEPGEFIKRARESDPDRVALIVFTSGTSSGSPKGCPRTATSLTGVSDAQDPTFNINKPSTRFLLMGATFRIIAPQMTLSTLGCGGAVVIPAAAFNSKSALQAIENHGVTHAIFVPFQLHALANDPSFSSRDVRSMRYAILGADMITKELLLKAENAFPSAKVAVGHGMSEGGGCFNWPFFNTALEDVPYFGSIAPLGRVAVGSRIRVHTDKGFVAKFNEPGELQICSPNTIKRYIGGADEGSFYEDDIGSWFKTGDLAIIRKDGVIYILGRIKDSFHRAGIPITPAALESCIAKYIGFQVSIFGVPHRTLGREPFAVVENHGGKSEEQIKRQILDVFGKDYALGGVASLQQLGLDEFPVNATGKIMKITLQEHVSQFLDH